MKLLKLLTEASKKKLFLISADYNHDYEEPLVVGVVEISDDFDTYLNSRGNRISKSYDRLQYDVLTIAKKQGLLSNVRGFNAKETNKAELSKLKKELEKKIDTLEDQITALSPNTIVTEDFRLTENTKEELFRSIKRNSRVTIETPRGQALRGKAVMYNRQYDSWVLNLGGKHGTPGIATVKNIIAVDGKLVKEDLDTLKKEKDTLTKQKKDLSTKRKSITGTPGGGDKTASAELGKKISDIGAKQADVSLKIAKEKELKEGRLDPHVEDSILTIAKSDRVAYDRKDATAAVEYAIATYTKEIMKDLMSDLKGAKNDLVRELKSYWKREGHI